MFEINHGKQTVITSYYDGSVASIKNEYEVSLLSSKENLLKDIIDALDVITRNETNKLTLEVCIDTKGRYRLVKKWMV